MDLHISVLYLPQLIGLAMGLPESDLGLGFNLALTESWRHRVHARAS
jgi:heterodisulfide reductase subunit B2